MNGRVYDPALGRFLSADPTVQFTNNLQNYNRYSYVNNNPLSYTDPSGFGIFSKIKKAFKKVSSNKWVRLGAGIVAAVVAAPYAVGYIALLTGNATLAYAAGGFVGGFALGGAVSGNLQGAVTGGLRAAAFAAAGQAGGILGTISNLGDGLGGVVLQGGIGGILRSGSTIAKSFNRGNTVAGSTKEAEFNAVRSAVVGGATASAGDRKFVNGAQTAAFSYLFNDALSPERDEYYHDKKNTLGSRMEPLGVVSESREGIWGKTVGLFVDVVSTVKGGVTLERGIGSYQKIDTIVTERRWYQRGTDRLLRTEEIGGRRDVINVSGAQVPGYDYVGEGIYTRDTLIFNGFPATIGP